MELYLKVIPCVSNGRIQLYGWQEKNRNKNESNADLVSCNRDVNACYHFVTRIF